MSGLELSWLAHIKMQYNSVFVAVASPTVGSHGVMMAYWRGAGAPTFDNIVRLMVWSGPTVAGIWLETAAIHSGRRGAANRPTA